MAEWLAVDGEDVDPLCPRAGEHEFAADDEALLVGEGDVFARLDGGKRRLEPGEAGHGDEHDVCLGEGARLFKRRLAAGKAHAAGNGNGLPLRTQRRKGGAIGCYLLCKQPLVLIGGHGDDAEAGGVAGGDGERLPADGTGAADEGDLFIRAPELVYAPAARDMRRAGAEARDVPRGICRAGGFSFCGEKERRKAERLASRKAVFSRQATGGTTNSANTMYTKVLANSVPSMRSRMPPWVGMSLPMSLTPRRRLMTLSTRSPKTVISEVSRPMTVNTTQGAPAQALPMPE